MGIPTLFRSDDVGAPTLSGTAGALIAVLKACLVDGYGVKPPLGWSMPFISVDLKTAVFLSGSAIDPQYLRVQHTSAGPVADRTAEWKVYETMSDENTGAGNWATGYVCVSSVISTSPKAWFLWGDENGFWLNIIGDSVGISDFTYSSGYSNLYYFGDLIPSDPTDTNACIVGCGKLDHYLSASHDNYLLSSSLAQTSTIAHKNVLGSAVSLLISAGPFSVAAGGAYANSTGVLGLAGSQHAFCKVIAFDGDGRPKGFMPGLYAGSVINDYSSRGNLAHVTDDFYHVHHVSDGGAYYVAYALMDGADWRA